MASRGLPSDVEQLSRVTEISVCTEHYKFFFWNSLPSKIEFKLGHALLYEFYTEARTCSIR